MKRILAIDYGQSRVGIAISDELGIIAAPYTTLSNEGNNPLIEKIKDIITKEGIGKIVVGLPLYYDGNRSKQTEDVLQFVTKLREKIDIEVTEYDERYSSVEAQDIINKKKSKKTVNSKINRIKGNIDRIAASIILQNYLDSYPK